MTSLSKKLSTDILISGLLDLSPRIRGIIFLPLITAYLGVDAYGAYIQLMTVTGLCVLFSNLSLKQTYEKLAQDNKYKKGTLYSTLSSFSTIISIILFILISVNSIVISKLSLATVEYASIFQIGAVLIPARVLKKYSLAYYRSEMQIKKSAMLRSVNEYSKLGVGSTLIIIFNVALLDLVWMIVIIESIFAVLLQVAVIRKLSTYLPTYSYLSDSLVFSGWLTISIISSQLASRADRLMIGFFIGSQAVGIYSIAYGLASLLTVFVSPIQNTFFPEFSRLLSENREREVAKYASAGILFFIIIGIPGISGLYFVSSDIIEIFADTQTESDISSLVTLITVGIFFYGLAELHALTLVADGNVKIISFIRGSAAILNIILNVFLLPSLGVVGAALATACTYGTSAFLLNKRYRSQFSLEIDSRILASTFFSAVFMTLILSLFSHLHFLILVILGVIFYTILMVGINKERLTLLVRGFQG